MLYPIHCQHHCYIIKSIDYSSLILSLLLTYIGNGTLSALGLGLPFQLSHPTSPNFDHQILVNFEDRTGPAADRRQHEAIRHWIRASWRGVSSPTIADTVSYDDGRHSAWVVEGRTSGPSGVCPHPNYMSHIITKSAL